MMAMASSAVSAAGTMIGGMQANAQARYEAGVADRNAGLATEQARSSIEQGRYEARDFFRRVAQTKGQQIASMAANGIDVGYGSAQRLQEDTQMLADEDARNLYHGQAERTRGFDIDAWNHRTSAAAARSRGRSALVSSAFGAGTTLMNGFVQMRGLRDRLGITGGA